MNVLGCFLMFTVGLSFASCEVTRPMIIQRSTSLDLNGSSGSSKRAVVKDDGRPTAMEMILAVNSRRRRHRILTENRMKRTNITGAHTNITGASTNTTGTNLNMTSANTNNTDAIANLTSINTNTTSTNVSADEIILETNKEEKVADDLLEGDIVLDPMDPEDFQIIKLREENKDGLVEDTIRKRQATRQMKRLWHNRRVPYEIHNSLYNVRDKILSAIYKFNKKSCVHFVPRVGDERDWITFLRNDGCYSSIGRAFSSPGSQTISIGNGCEFEPTIFHEMLHAVGFFHEQSRPDRDRFLKILWNNVEKKFEDQFLRYSHGAIDQFGLNYNYKSIMHYPNDAFSANGRDTMQSITEPTLKLGSDGFSNQDLIELDTLYDCKTTTYNSWTNWGTFSPCDDNCYKSRQRYCYGRYPTSCGGNPNQYGIENQWIQCGSNECPERINGNWGRWEPWGDCSVNCNEGVEARTRTCDDPRPANGGLACPGSNTDYRICRRQRCVLGTYDTDFRNGRLGVVWQNDINDTPGFDWVIGQGSTRTESTGPNSDHFGDTTGYYLYVESSGRVRNDNARLISRMMPALGQKKKCLKFFYHMFGSTTGTLSISIYPKPGSPRSIFSKSGNKGSRWKFATVTVESANQFQLVIEARINGPSYSDIAIDELFLDDGSCDCQDDYVNCMSWARKGECVNSTTFMSKHCRRACSLCGCQDKDNRCPGWGLAECRRNRYWMEAQCPLTCRVCHCHDDNIACAGWASENQCVDNPSFMNVSCRKSCNLCTVGVTMYILCLYMKRIR